MKKLYLFALYALMAPVATFGISSALAQEQQSTPEPTQDEVKPTAEDLKKGPHIVTIPTAERTDAQTESEKRAQQKRSDADMRQGQSDAKDAGDTGMAERKAQGSTSSPRATPATFLTSRPANSFRADQLIGSDLKSSTDAETIGSISELVISEDGQVLAVIVEVGGFLAIGQKNVAVPWDSVQRTMNEKGDGYELRASSTKEELRDAPEYQTKARKY